MYVFVCLGVSACVRAHAVKFYDNFFFSAQMTDGVKGKVQYLIFIEFITWYREIVNIVIIIILCRRIETSSWFIAKEIYNLLSRGAHTFTTRCTDKTQNYNLNQFAKPTINMLLFMKIDSIDLRIV